MLGEKVDYAWKIEEGESSSPADTFYFKTT